MDRLEQLQLQSNKALVTLIEITRIKTPTPIERDAMIQRFEYSFDTTWKFVKLFLQYREGLALSSPKSVIRATLEVGLLSEDRVQELLAMADDRNLTPHTYNEELAIEIAAKIPAHATLLQHWC